MNRREFLETSSVLASGAVLGAIPIQSTPPMIGIQIGAVSFVDEGTDRVLDALREMASINTLFVATFTYGRGIAGRQLPNQPLPDHGKQEYDTATFRGGNYATPHPQYYRNTSIKPEHAPDHGAYDVLGDVLPRAHSRNLKVIAWFEDVFAADVPGFEQAREVMVDGQRSTFSCTRNPDTRNFWLGLVEDYVCGTMGSTTRIAMSTNARMRSRQRRVLAGTFGTTIRSLRSTAPNTITPTTISTRIS
jgi:hypothetical protein